MGHPVHSYRMGVYRPWKRISNAAMFLLSSFCFLLSSFFFLNPMLCVTLDGLLTGQILGGGRVTLDKCDAILCHIARLDMRHIQYQCETLPPLVLAFHLVLGKFLT